MSEERLQQSWWLLSRARGTGLVLRILILLCPVASIVCTRMAASETVPALDLVVVGLVLVCVVLPDSHVGLLVVLLVGVTWLATVDDSLTPWSLALAVSLTGFHAAVAAACVAPPAARWSRAMCRRWTGRSAAVMVASGCTWLAVAALGTFDFEASGVLVTAALAALAIAALWARDGTLDAGNRR